MRALLIFLQVLVLYYTVGESATNETGQAANDNPKYVKGRKKEIYKPEYPGMYNRFKKPYHPAWQDYCDPYHCNDYHLAACGLNRKTKRFKWFQSVCHLILDNQCATYRGFLKYDLVDNKYCTIYVMYLRSQCRACDDDDDEVPICAVSSTNRVVLFKNRCSMDQLNCEGKEDYEQVQMFLCEFYVHSLVK